MMQDAHTPSRVRYVPWHVEEGAPAVRTADNWLLCATSSDADAERIADCWNACVGIPDPSVVKEAIEALRASSAWLQAAIFCPTWHWDGDQHQAALHDLATAQSVLAKIGGAT